LINTYNLILMITKNVHESRYSKLITKSFKA
jgi:hypothetical protein